MSQLEQQVEPIVIFAGLPDLSKEDDFKDAPCPDMTLLELNILQQRDCRETRANSRAMLQLNFDPDQFTIADQAHPKTE